MRQLRRCAPPLRRCCAADYRRRRRPPNPTRPPPSCRTRTAPARICPLLQPSGKAACRLFVFRVRPVPKVFGIEEVGANHNHLLRTSADGDIGNEGSKEKRCLLANVKKPMVVVAMKVGAMCVCARVCVMRRWHVCAASVPRERETDRRFRSSQPKR